MPTSSRQNRSQAHRHAVHAYEDFQALVRRREFDSSLINSISHHLRHAVYRTGLEVPPERRIEVERGEWHS